MTTKPTYVSPAKSPAQQSAVAEAQRYTAQPDLSQRYPGTWGVTQGTLSSGAGPQDFFRNLISQYRGGQNLTDFLRWSAPFQAATLYDSPGAQHVRDPNNWDASMQAYGVGAGRIGQQATQSMRQGQEQLGRMGLGRSAAMAGLASQTQMTAANAQSNLFTQLHQQGVQNRLAGARGALDADRMIMQLALGMNPAPRVDTGGGAQAAAGLGQGIGNLAGSAMMAIAMCWVAREVIPDRWLDARAFILNEAEPELREAYLRHGPALAEAARRDPALKAELVPVMTALADAGAKYR